MTFNAKVKGNFVYITDEKLKDKLIEQGFEPLYKSNSEKDIWIFARNEGILGHLMFDKENKDKFITSDRMTF